MLTVLDIDRESQQDGDRWLRQSLIGLLAAVLLTAGGWWMQTIDARLTAQIERQNADRERLATIEAQLRSQDQRLDTIADGLKEASARIDAKLDRMIGLMVGPGDGRRFDK